MSRSNTKSLGAFCLLRSGNKVWKTNSAGSNTYLRDGASVTAPVLSDGSATFTPGISESRSGVSTFYGRDRLGSNNLQETSSSTVAYQASYDAFGLVKSSSGSTASPFGFVGAAGYQTGQESGLMLLGHRYYDASTGRFLTRDPVKDGNNWYAFGDNNPLKNIDPLGLWDWGQYWHDVVRVLGGEGEGIISPITGTIGTINNLINGGWKHPITTLIAEPIEGIWNTLQGAWNGDPTDAGRIVGSAAAIAICGKAGAGLGDDDGGLQVSNNTNIVIRKYPNTGGGGITIRTPEPANPSGWTRVIGIDIHGWGPKGGPDEPIYKWPHLHIGSGNHWPWE